MNAANVLVWVVLVMNCCTAECPPGCQCSSTASVECTCEPEQKFTLSRSFPVKPENLKIYDCGRVEVLSNAFSDMNLTFLVFEKLGILVLNPFSLVSNGNIQYINLTRVSDLKLASDSIKLLNIRNFSMTDVNIPYVPENSISFKEVQSLIRMDRCNFVSLYSSGIYAMNINKFFIYNSTLHSVETDGVVVKNATFFEMDDTILESINESSFSVWHTEGVQLSGNYFRELPTQFLVANVGLFLFNLNVVDISRKNAFAGIELDDDALAYVDQNTFRHLEPNSLLGSNVPWSLAAVGNSFHCDCRLGWMVRGGALYRTYMHSGSCRNHRGYGPFAMENILTLYYPESHCEKMEKEEGQWTDDVETQSEDYSTHTNLLSFSPHQTLSMLAYIASVLILAYRR